MKPSFATRPTVELLEDRSVPAIASISLSGGILTVNTTEGRDIVTVSNPNASQIVVRVQNQDAPTDFGPYSSAAVNRIDVNLGRGNDDFWNNTSEYAVVHGGGDRDWLFGGSGWDDLFGDAGDDVLSGRGSEDLIYGGIGNDELWGDDGYDTLYGEAGADSLWGGNHDDYLDGGYDGTGDRLSGGWGSDTCVLHKYKPWWSWSWYTESDTVYDQANYAYDYYADVVTYMYH